MNRYTPFQRACAAGLAGFLLSLVLLWLLLAGTGHTLWTLLLLSLGIGLIVCAVAWLLTSVSDLHYQVAALRAEVERLKNKE